MVPAEQCQNGLVPSEQKKQQHGLININEARGGNLQELFTAQNLDLVTNDTSTPPLSETNDHKLAKVGIPSKKIMNSGRAVRRKKTGRNDRTN